MKDILKYLNIIPNSPSKIDIVDAHGSIIRQLMYQIKIILIKYKFWIYS